MKSFIFIISFLVVATGHSSTRHYPTDYYCEVDNIEFLGDEFYNTNCKSGKAHTFAKVDTPVDLPTGQYYVLDHALPGQVVIDSALNLIRLENTFNGQEFYWASRARVFPSDVIESLAKKSIYSEKWTSEQLDELKKYINSISIPHIYAIYYNDVYRGGTGETVYYLIYDPLKATVLVISRVLYLE